MEKRSIGKLLVGEWNTKTVVGVALGAILFAVNIVFIQVPIFTQVQLSLAPLVVVIVGGMFGPLACGISMMIGNFLADMIGGWGFWFDWTLADLVYGFIIGLLPVYGAKISEGIFTKKQMIIFGILAIVGPLFAYCAIAPIFTMMWYEGELAIGMLQGLIAGLKDGVMSVVLGIPVLKVMANRNLKKMNLSEE